MKPQEVTIVYILPLSFVLCPLSFAIAHLSTALRCSTITISGSFALEDSPSLKSYLSNRLMECYQYGCKLASKHSQLPLNTFPEKAIAPLEQILDENWLP